jgi:hypothetical protein
MVNSQVVAETIEAFKLDKQRDNIPNPIPVIEVGTKSTKNGFCLTANKTTTGSLSISAADLRVTDKTFFLTGFTFDMIKDATCDIATGNIPVFSVLFDTGVSVNLAALSVLTLTAQNMSISIHLSHPIKILKNSSISLGGTFSLGTMSRSLTVYGYVDEVL